jgi:hypothetical protein
MSAFYEGTPQTLERFRSLLIVMLTTGPPNASPPTAMGYLSVPGLPAGITGEIFHGTSVAPEIVSLARQIVQTVTPCPATAPPDFSKGGGGWTNPRVVPGAAVAC